MTPGDFPLTLYHGDTYRWTFVLWADADKTVPADLSAVTVKAEMRDKPGGAKVTSLATSIIPPNSILLEIDAETSKDMPLAGAWDLQLTYATGEVATVLAGVVAVTMDVTDSAVPAAPSPLVVVPIPVTAVSAGIPNRAGRVVLVQMSDKVIVEVVAVEASTITVDVVAAPPAVVAVDVIAPGPAAMVIEIAEVGSGPVGYPQLPEELRYVPISFPFSDLPPPGGMVNVPMGFDLEVPVGLLGTQTFAINAPTEDATFVLNGVTEVSSMQRDYRVTEVIAVELGTITIPAGGATTPILAGPGGKLQAGDVLQIVCPQEQDASLADVGITVLTVRQ